jgi:tRNA(adenine34) deaminase
MPLTLSKMTDAELMERAVAQARLSLDEGVMPIGAVLACNGDVLAEAHWKGFQHGLLSHPEHEVLIDADRSIASRSRRESTLYTTLQPCLMCMGTATSFLLGRIVYALPAPADGASSVLDQWQPALGHPQGGGPYSRPEIEAGLGEADTRALVTAWLSTGVTGAEAEFARRTLG